MSTKSRAKEIDWNKFIGYRDYDYVAQREMECDGFWKTYERWFYYSRDNENYIIPTIIFCIIAIFTNPPYLGIFGCVLIICGALFLCHCNNRRLDMNPSIQQRRWEIRVNNEIFKKQGIIK